MQNLGTTTIPFSHRFGFISLLIALTLQATSVVAEPVIEEIVVRGEFREPTLGDLAASVSILEPGALGKTQVNHLEEILGWAPNVNFSSGASRSRFIQIRGIGERGQFVEPLNPSVGITLDGMDLTGAGTAGTLYDIAQVEVFRGPQSTLYGANAMAGFINLVTHDASDVFGGRIDLDLGDYGAKGLGAAVTGPISARSQFRLSVRQYEDDGFTDNSFLGKHDTGNRDELTIRGKLSWQPTDRHELDLSLGHIDIDNGYDAFSLDNNRTTRSDEPGRDRQDTQYASARWTWDAADTYQLTAQLGHNRADADYGYDEDWTFVGFHPFGYRSTDRYQRERRSTNLEVRIVSTPEGALFSNSTAWTLGAYSLTQDVDLNRDYTFAAQRFSSTFNFDRTAIYGELAHRANQSLRVIGGLRVERHNARYRDNAGSRFSPDETLVGGRLLVEWDHNSGAMLYAGLTRGYKTGLFNTDGSLDSDLREYDSESLWSLELGIKATALESRLNFNAAAFWMDRRDMQVATSLVRVRPDNSVEFIDLVGNAASGYNYGLELEAQYAVNGQLQLDAALGILRTELDDFVNGNGERLDGRDQSQAPGYQFLVGIQYQPAPALAVRVELEGRDDYLLSDSHREQAPGYTLVNASIVYNAERWQAKVWGRNLTDKDTFVRGFFFGNDPRDNYTARGFNQLGAPRNFGVSLTMTF